MSSHLAYFLIQEGSDYQEDEQEELDSHQFLVLSQFVEDWGIEKEDDVTTICGVITEGDRSGFILEQRMMFLPNDQ